MEPGAKGDDLAFRTKLRNGNALVQSRWIDSKYKRSDSISCMIWRVQRNTGINTGRSFYSLRRTGATMIERINPTVTEMYLAHAQKGMKKNYAERNRDALEKATDELGKQLALYDQA